MCGAAFGGRVGDNEEEVGKSFCSHSFNGGMGVISGEGGGEAVNSRGAGSCRVGAASDGSRVGCSCDKEEGELVRDGGKETGNGLFEVLGEEAEGACEDVSSVVVGGEKENIISFGKHWGVFGDFNKKAVEEVLDRVLEDKRKGMLFVSEEGDIGGLVGELSDEDNVEIGDPEDLEVEEEEDRVRAMGAEDVF